MRLVLGRLVLDRLVLGRLVLGRLVAVVAAASLSVPLVAAPGAAAGVSSSTATGVSSSTATWAPGGSPFADGGPVSTSDDGAVVLVGNPYASAPNGTSASGAATLSMRSSSGQWTTTTIYAPTAEPAQPSYYWDTNGYFGSAVAVSADGEAAVITAVGLGQPFGPIAFTFSLSVTNGVATATPTGFLSARYAAPTSPDANTFGQSAAIFHDASTATTEAFVGDPGAVGGSNRGVVYEYTDPTLQTYGNGNNNYQPDEGFVALYDGTDSSISGLGTSVAVAPQHLLIAGAPTSSPVAQNQGALVSWSWGNWPENGEPSAPSAVGTNVSTTELGLAAGDRLGSSVATTPDATVVAAGAPYAITPTTTSPTASGVVQVYNLSGSASGPAARRPGSASAVTCQVAQVGPQAGAAPSEGYGTSVAVSDDGSTILVGAPSTGFNVGYDAPPSATPAEYAYFETEAGAGWGCYSPTEYGEQAVAGPTQRSSNGVTTFGTYYGEAVAMAGDASSAYVGAPMDDINGFPQGYVYSFTGPPPPSGATISGTPPAASLGDAYSYTFTVGGNPAPAVTTTGTPPPGLTVSGATVSGTPTQAGSFPMTFTAANSLGQQSDQVVFTVAANPVISSLSPAQGAPSGGTSVLIKGSGFVGVTAVTVGTTSVAFTVRSSTAIVVTVPAGTGTAPVRVSIGSTTSAPKTFRYVAGDVAVSGGTLPGATKGAAYQTTLTASGTGTTTWKLAPGSAHLPHGLTLSTSGVLSGTPTVSGTFSFSVEAVRSPSNDTATETITIAP